MPRRTQLKLAGLRPRFGLSPYQGLSPFLFPTLAAGRSPRLTSGGGAVKQCAPRSVKQGGPVERKAMCTSEVVLPLLADAVEVGLGADEEGAVRDGHRREGW